MVGFLKKVLGGGKDGYFLQLDEDGDNQSSPPQPSETKTEAKTKVESEKAEVSEPSKPQETKAPKVKPEVKKEEVKPQPVPVPTVSTDNGKMETAQPKVVLFAPDNLMPKPTQTRRRPGPSLGMFKSMAKEVNPNIR
ncbi:MAG: hypothetical protein SAJ12_19090 [Jaaginema sp. PMC 1079.18]|nr:hypothetical protein [Jaaginema sp. PMC 1080.18]MEC4853093.1 hypothetical protein [Jaaginema sp. PMC 1079.18]MEC4868489.1 hypothetical protein [Jaaginema sp. PMC 1078.18]